jgi:arylsulfatase A-like enzyme
MTNYYSSNPQCSPARAALLTGSYGYRVGIPDVLQPYSKRPDRGNGLHHDELTIAELLKERGYAIGAIGKWHLGRTSRCGRMRRRSTIRPIPAGGNIKLACSPATLLL